MAIALSQERRYAEAESLVRRALRTGTSPVYYFNGLAALVGQGRHRAADSLLEAFGRAAPGSALVPLWRGLLASSQADYATPERNFRAARAVDSSSPFLHQITSIGLARTVEARGLIAAAHRELASFIAACEQRDASGCVIEGWVNRALLDVVYRGRVPEALASVDSVLARYPLASMSPLDRPYSKLTYLNVRAGRLAKAKQLWREYESAVPQGYRRADLNRFPAAGALAEAEGRQDDALAVYQEWYRTDGYCGACGLYEIAALFDRAGQVDSALAYLGRMLSTPGILRLVADGPARAATYKRLGELYEARDDRPRAAEYYSRFVELWKDADPELQPGVRDVRERLARLSQEPGN